MQQTDLTMVTATRVIEKIFSTFIFSRETARPGVVVIGRVWESHVTSQSGKSADLAVRTLWWIWLRNVRIAPKRKAVGHTLSVDSRCAGRTNSSPHVPSVWGQSSLSQNRLWVDWNVRKWPHECDGRRALRTSRQQLRPRGMNKEPRKWFVKAEE